MSTAELKSNLHKLIDAIQDSKTLNILYNYLIRTFKKKSSQQDNSILTHFSSESSLAKDWNRPEEDLAWKNL